MGSEESNISLHLRGAVARALIEESSQQGVEPTDVVFRALAFYVVCREELDNGRAVLLRPQFDDVDLPQLLRVDVFDASDLDVAVPIRVIRAGLIRWPPVQQ